MLVIQNTHDFIPENDKIEIGDNEGVISHILCEDDMRGYQKKSKTEYSKKYGQTESTAQRRFGGTGLGLAVS